MSGTSATLRRLAGRGGLAVAASGLAACGSSGSSSGSTTSAATSDGSASVDGKNVAVVSVADSNPWAAVFNKAVKTNLEKEGAKVTVTVSADPSGQPQLLNQAIAEKP